MISYNYESDFTLGQEEQYSKWLSAVIESENKNEGEINYIFCDDEYLHKINMEYLQHDDLTDIISFDYCVGNELNGDIFISIERVAENAKEYEVEMETELLRVMAHGILHYCGYKDKSEEDATLMRSKEDEKMKMFAINW